MPLGLRFERRSGPQSVRMRCLARFFFFFQIFLILFLSCGIGRRDRLYLYIGGILVVVSWVVERGGGGFFGDEKVWGGLGV